MKQTLFILLLISAAGLSSCRKNKVDPDIKQYDQNQIESYISANGLSQMKRDTSGGDTTGIYYQIINPGSGSQLNYYDNVSLVFTIRSFDGKYNSLDTLANHFDGFLGHLSALSLPNGLQIAIHDILKHRGGSMRLLIPSHLAYGVNGYGTGSVTNTSGRIAGNQCLDYYVNVIDDQAKYDDMVIKNYMNTNGLNGYTKSLTGLYYKITTPGTGASPINENTTITATYTGNLLDGSVFDSANSTTAVSLNIPDLVPGVQEGLGHTTSGGSVSLLIPSALGYGKNSFTGIPANACLQFSFSIATVSP